MPLDLPGLTAAFVALFESKPASPALAAQGMADAYTAYVGTGTFGPNVAVVTPAHTSALKATLLASIVNPLVGLPATHAAAWAAGVATFWTAMPVAGPVQAGACPSCPGAAAITGTMTALLANPLNTSLTAALGMATALDVATKTCIATVAPPPATNIPIA